MLTNGRAGNWNTGYVLILTLVGIADYQVPYCVISGNCHKGLLKVEIAMEGIQNTPGHYGTISSIWKLHGSIDFLNCLCFILFPHE